MQPYTQLFGNTLLFEVLNDPHKAEVVKVQHNYGVQDFIQNTGKNDVFGILPKEFAQERSIYVDYGSGWDSEQRLVEKYTLNNYVKFEMMGSFRQPKDGKIGKFRFDPAERIMVRVKLSEVLVDGKKAAYVGENALSIIDETEIFTNLDPIYSINFEPCETEKEVKILIKGEIFRLSDDEISSVIMKNFYQTRDQIYDYEFKLCDNEAKLRNNEAKLRNNEAKLRNYEEQQNQLCSEIAHQKERIQESHMQNETLQQKIMEVENELNAIKNTKAYRVYKKVSGIFRK